jgi:uncharacterized protein involved in exopolysaccharide biosynthesis
MSEQQAPYASTSADDEIDLLELFGILWKERWLISAITAVFALSSLVFVLLQTNIYRAEAVLVPADASQSGNSLSTQLGGAAALIGLDMSNPNSGRISNSLAILSSRDFIRRFIKEHDILVPLFAGEWDSLNGSQINPEIYDVTTGEWLLENGEPTDLQAHRAFIKNLTTSQDPVSGIITVAYDWHDPVLAARWVNQMVADINFEIKAADVQEANHAITYLRSQLETTQLVEMQKVFYQLIEAQTRVTMLADVRDEYVFQVIDPAVVSDQTIAPLRLLTVIIGVMAGGAFAIMFVFLRRALRKTP